MYSRQSVRSLGLSGALKTTDVKKKQYFVKRYKWSRISTNYLEVPKQRKIQMVFDRRNVRSHVYWLQRDAKELALPLTQ
jgi:hypothetical protein